MGLDADGGERPPSAPLEETPPASCSKESNLNAADDVGEGDPAML